MRNHRFRLSDMIPNSWFYKLKGMGKKSGKNQNNNNNSCIKKHQNQSCSSLSSSSYSSTKTITTQRKSYYFTRDLNCPPPHHHISPEPRRKSSHKRRSAATAASRATTPRNLTSSVSADSDSPLDSTSYSSEQDSLLPDLLPSSAATASAAATGTFDGMLSHCEFDTVSKIKTSLPPIITKPKKFDYNILIKPEPNQNQLYRSIVKKNTDNNIVTRNRGNREKQRTCSVLKKTGHSPGLKLRTNSPRIGNPRITQGRKSTSIVGKSFAVVKSSNDPQRDFMESMVEMIVENNIRGSKDLENLLACYLSLNASEYHDLIIKVFKQIWFDITDVRLK